MKKLEPILRRTPNKEAGGQKFLPPNPLPFCPLALAVYGYNHKKVNHEKNEFVRDGTIHVNGIENFWSYAKRRLSKFNGVPKKLFPFYLLESEWRFNHRSDILITMKKLIRNYQPKLIVHETE